MLTQNFLSGFSPDLFVNSLNGKSEAYVFHNKFPAHMSVYVPLPQLWKTQYIHSYGTGKDLFSGSPMYK